MGVARALIGQARFADAEPLMIEAERVLARNDSPRGAHRRTVEVLAQLYEAWDQAKPGQRYRERSLPWKAKLK